MKRTVSLGATIAMAAVAAVVLPASSAFAATLTVSTTADVASNFGACGNAGQISPSGGSLREAICVANNAGGASSTINVAAGTYTLINGELQMGKVSGSNITLTGAGAGSTIINGNNASRVFDLDPNVVGGVTTSISGVTITNGAVTTFGGAGIIAGSGNTTTRDVLALSNSVISNNHVNSTSTNRYGGGVEFQGGSLTVTNSTFSGNTSGSSSGSGLEYQHLDVASGEQLTVSGSTFTGNSANASVPNINVGGAVHLAGVSASVPMSVTNTVFTGNTVVGSGIGIPQGGAIFSEGGALTVTESTFTSNSVAGGSNPQGGAISILGGTAQVHYNRIKGNTGATGSGASLGISSGATLDAVNNWWGCNTGPGTAGCDSVAGGVTVSPRLVLTATASPATVVGPNATSTITATLTQNSLGSVISGANLDAFAGLPVGWSDPLPSGATVGSASTNLSSGSTSVSFNSQSSSGPGHVVATLDNGTSTASLTVNRAPAITSANTAGFTVGTAGTFTVSSTGYPAAAISRTGTLPAGMSFVDNGNGTATLSGTPSAGSGGSYPLGLTASNGVNPNATQTLTVTVTQPPGFTSANTAAFTVGTAGTFTVSTTGYPTVAISKTGTLPPGLSFVDNGNGTATLSGTPSAGAGGSYPLGLTASNGVNPNATQTLTVTVNQSPVISSADHATFAVGRAGSFDVTSAAGYPTATTVSESGSLPAGVSFTPDGSGGATLAGTPAAGTAGTYPVTFTASNGAAPDGAQSFTLTVEEPPTPSITTPADGDSYPFAAVPDSAFSCTAGAQGTLLSGLDGCSASIDGSAAVGSGSALAGSLGPHTVVVTATDAAGYVTSAEHDYTVVPADQVIVFTSVAPSDPRVGDTYTATATGGGSGNPIVFSATSGSAATCTVSAAGAVTYIGTGTCRVRADQAGTANYNAALPAHQYSYVRTPQVIKFTSRRPPAAVVGDTYLATAAGGPSGKPITFAASPADAGICTVTPTGTVSFTGAGSCVIQARQAGTSKYRAAYAQQRVQVSPV